MLEALLEEPSSQSYHEGIFSALKEQDSQVYELITKEYERLQNSLQLIAAANQCSRAVLAALGSVVQNKTAEGFPGPDTMGAARLSTMWRNWPWTEPKMPSAPSMQMYNLIPAARPTKLSSPCYWREEIKY